MSKLRIRVKKGLQRNNQQKIENAILDYMCYQHTAGVKRVKTDDIQNKLGLPKPPRQKCDSTHTDKTTEIMKSLEEKNCVECNQEREYKLTDAEYNIRVEKYFTLPKNNA